MLSLILQVTVICSVSWSLCKYFRQLVGTSPLDNVPGPASRSFLFGECDDHPLPDLALMLWIVGNLTQLLDRQAWSFLDHLTESYPGVAKLDGAFGVSPSHLLLP